MKQNAVVRLNDSFISVMLRRTISASIDPSALRNQGAPGMIAQARSYIGTIDFAHIGAVDAVDFSGLLDSHTERLMLFFPANARTWGAARKAVNLAFRDILYNTYLCKEYGFAKYEPWLELPLDSYVANGLNAMAGWKLPKWLGIKHLSKSDNQVYQNEARRIAHSVNIAPIHLDVYFWRNIGILSSEK